MSNITAILIDTREPSWIKSLKFGGLPILFDALSTGDIQALTDDGCELLIERKTPDDFLNTLKDARLFPQVARMTEKRNAQLQAGETPTVWSYLVVTGVFNVNHDGKVITQRGVTGWNFAAVMGAILSIQELGVHVVFCNGDGGFEDCVLRLGKRNRDSVMRIMPARIPNVFGPKAEFLSSLPGIGIEKVQEILDWSNNNVSHALIGLTDMEIKSPIGLSIRRKLRDLMGLQDGERFEITGTQIQEIVQGEK